MSLENVELTQRAAAAFDRRDLRTFLRLMDDEVEIVSRFVPTEGGYHGHDGVRRWWGNFYDAFPDVTLEVLEVRDLGALTLTRWRVRVHAVGSNPPVAQTIWALLEWRDKKCVWLDGRYLAEADALEAVRVRETARR